MIQDTQGQDQVIDTSPKKRYLTWLLSSAALIAIALLSWPTISMWYYSVPKVEADTITVSKVQRGDLVRNISVSGKIVAANAPQLYSSERGKVTMLAKPGESVQKGQLVAQIDSPELNSLVEQQKSTLQQLEIDNRRASLTDMEAQLNLEQQMNATLATFNVAKREYQRADLSYQKNIVSEVDWLSRKDMLANAERAYLHSTKRVELAKQRLEFEAKNREIKVQKQKLVLEELQRRQVALEILAPVGGIVGNWLVEQKNQVAANTPIMTVVDLSEFEAEIAVPEFYADELGLGLPVELSVGGEQLAAEIIAISPEIKGNQIQIRTQITASDRVKLRQNQRVSAEIEFEKKLNTLFIKRGSFIGSNQGKFLYKVVDNRAHKIEIQTGINSVAHVEILSGVQLGDEIIISDYEEYNGAAQLQIAK